MRINFVPWIFVSVVPSFTCFALSPFPFLFCLSIQSAIGHLSLSLSLSLSFSFNLAHDKSPTFDLSRVACPPFLHASYPFLHTPSSFLHHPLSPPFLDRSTFASFNSTCLFFFFFLFLFSFSLPPRCPLSPFPTSRCPDSAFYTFLRRIFSSPPPSISKNWPVKKTFSNKKSNRLRT